MVKYIKCDMIDAVDVQLDKGGDVRDFQQSKLWQLTLKARENDSHESARERLREAFDIFWDRAVQLAQQISSDLPSLTLHDVRHLVALWDRASQLIDDSYPINPLEAFVFGGAVLLHDSGHAFAAYKGGLDELQRTTEYRDAVAASLRKNGSNPPGDEEIANPTAEIAAAALFSTLRRLHAKQAEVLATRTFGEKALHLIDDSELRESLAQMIGRIAASHHWDRNSLEEQLPPSQNAPGFLPEEWRIRPVKIACLLRCADAIQIDQRRAPAFAFALHAPQGLSRLHWLAQQLAQPSVVKDGGAGPYAVEFTSQNDFKEEDADAWWIAYGLVRIANQELQGCYQLLKDLNLPAFVVDRVSGAEGPLQLARHIRTSGWKPINAEVRVSSVEQIVNLFGGRLLYGRDPVVPLRELIQNASDAVRARRALNLDPHYEGKVNVSLNAARENDTWQLVVEDDGVGMSERVLSGALLEFGKSFWASDEVQDEFPGLISAKLRQSGRYGIGFFSCLMIAERIEVTSRRWDKGQQDARKLVFRDGLRLRPLVSESIGAPLGQISTRVVLYIASKDAELLLTILGERNVKFKVALKELVAHLCLCLDCNVFTSESGGPYETAHSRRWYESDALQWCREITFAEPRADQDTDDALSAIAPLIQVIEGSDGEPCGRAAISCRNIETGIDSIGGLASARAGRKVGNLSTFYVGGVEYEPNGPRRDTGSLRAPAEVKAWASKQAQLLAQSQISDWERYYAAMNVAKFEGDPTPIATILINRNTMSLTEVYRALDDGKEIFAVLGQVTRNGPLISMINYWLSAHQGIALGFSELDFAVSTMEAWLPGSRFPLDELYHRVPAKEEPVPSSFLSCLERYALLRGRTLNMEVVNDMVFATYKGEPSARERLSAGAELRSAGIKLKLA